MCVDIHIEISSKIKKRKEKQKKHLVWQSQTLNFFYVIPGKCFNFGIQLYINMDYL